MFFKIVAAASISSRITNHLRNCSGRNVITLWGKKVQYLSTTPKILDVYSVQDEADFREKVLQSKKPVVVDFHATWCGPCKTLMPRLELVIATSKNAVDLAKVDIDNHPEIAMEYGVGAVPSVLGFKNGKIIDKFVGVKDQDELKTFVDKLKM